MRRYLTSLRSVLMFGLSLVYLSNLFIGSTVLTDVALGLLIAVTGLSLTVVTGSSRIISYTAFLISALLLLVYRAPLGVWAEAFEENLYMVVMFIMIPLLSIPIRRGGYFEALQRVFRRFVNTRSRFYLFISLVSAFIGSIVNLAVVPLVYEVAKASPLIQDKRLLSGAITRGFTTSTIWAPTTAAIALVMQLTGTKWQSFFPYGISCGVMAGIVGYIIMMLEIRREVSDSPLRPASPLQPTLPQASALGSDPASTGSYLKFAELCGFGLVLMVLITLISYLSGIHTIAIVALAALFFPIVWMGILRRLPVLLREFKETYFLVSLPNLKSEVTLFVAAGFFTVSIGYSQLGDHVARALIQAVGGNVLLLTVAVVAVCMGLAALGVHPIITVAVFGGTVKAATLGVSPEYMAIVLAMCWAIGLTVSPSSATIIAAAGLTRQSPVRVGTRWNGVYAPVAAVVLIGLITLLRLTGLL